MRGAGSFGSGSDRLRAFVAQMKLTELRSARDRLADEYDEIEAHAHGMPDPEAIRLLADGLAAMRVAERPVHPEIANLEVAAGAADPALAARVRARLEAAVRQGRARADVMPLFAGVLGERLAPDRRRPRAPDPRAGLLASWLRPSQATGEALIARIERRVDPGVLARARAIVRERTAEAVLPRSPDISIAGPRCGLLDDEGRADAAAAIEIDAGGAVNPFGREVREALRLRWERIGGWDWPEAGIALEPVWAGHRHRLRPRLDLVNASVVQTIGGALDRALGAVCGRARLNRLLRLHRLEELDAPDIIVDNERTMLDGTIDAFGWLGPDDAIGEGGTIERARTDARMLEGADDAYEYSGAGIGRACALIRAEIALGRAISRPVFVLRTDIADYHPSVSHRLVLDLLRWLDVDPLLVTLIARALSMRLPDGTRTKSGLPLGTTLARAVDDLLMAMIIGEVRGSATVQLMNLSDDILIVAHDPAQLSAAWAALSQIVGEAGLELNLAKTGAMAFGAPLPADVPRGPVRWGVLELVPEGIPEGAEATFRVDPRALDAFAALTAERVAGHQALLDRVEVWRDQLAYLWTWLCPTADLGPGHLPAVQGAVRRLDAIEIVEEDGTAWPSIRAMLRGEVERRFLGGRRAELPDAWLHWPVTAGGLGLPYPPADAVPLELARRTREREELQEPMPAPVDSPEVDPNWGAWFARQLAPLAPVEPAATPAMDDRVARFVERGTRIGRESRPLAPRWRWVLHTLGPDILDAYGTFDFVATDLVPVQLIRSGLG